MSINEKDNKYKSNKLSKILNIIAGSISLSLGVIGIFVPLMPTTIFLIIAAYFYFKSSPKLYNWLVNHKIFGKYISDYRKYKAMPKKAKITAILMLWVTILISALIIAKLWAFIALFIVAISVTAYILSIKTLNLDEINTLREAHEET